MKKTILTVILLLALVQVVSAEQIAVDDIISEEATVELSVEEINGLVLMREEEKLARDVYLTLYDTWGSPIFNNIARSEQTHTTAVKYLLDKYSIEDPVTDDTVGVFTDEHMQELYDALVEQGSASLTNALIVGATIEDLDIYDLNNLLSETTNEDIITVYDNLRKGSINHMLSFTRQLTSQGETYEAQYLSAEELEEILSGDGEKGALLDENQNVRFNKAEYNNYAGRTDFARENMQGTGMNQARSTTENNPSNTATNQNGAMGRMGDLREDMNQNSMGRNTQNSVFAKAESSIYGLQQMNQFSNGIGEAVSQIATQYQNGYQQARTLEENINSRSGVSSFFFGGDRDSAQQLQLQVGTNRELIAELELQLEEATEEEAEFLQEQITVLEEECTRLETVAENENQKKGLFRW